MSGLTYMHYVLCGICQKYTRKVAWKDEGKTSLHPKRNFFGGGEFLRKLCEIHNICDYFSPMGGSLPFHLIPFRLIPNSTITLNPSGN